MELSGLRINFGMVMEDFQNLAVVALMGWHKFNTAMALLAVIPAHKIFKPPAALRRSGKWLGRIIRPVFNGAEQRL